MTFSLAFGIVNQAALSTSGKVISLPDFGGHWIVQSTLFSFSGLRSPSLAQMMMFFLLDCRNSPRLIRSDYGGFIPVSSSNSRSAASSGFSPGSSSPLGIDQPGLSLFAHSGPPMWAMKTSSFFSRMRKTRSPALVFMVGT